MQYSIIYLVITALSLFGTAQKEIVLSDDLVTDSEKLKVKMGTQWMGKIWKFKFGEYSVGQSKNGWQNVSSNSNFFGTTSNVKSTQKFSFELESGSSIKAIVDAATDIKIDTEAAVDILPFFSVGEDKLLLESVNFSATINIDSDTSDTWILLMRDVQGYEAQDQHQAYLSNGEKTIHLIPVNSNKKGEDKRSIPALGYELIEAGKALAAVQYYGGGMFGNNKNMVWIHNDLDEKMKLILAAAMTAVLQVKVNSTMGGL